MPVNFLTGQNTGFEGGKGTWTNGGNTTVADSATKAHTGNDSLSLTATAAGATSAFSCGAGNILTLGMLVRPNGTVFVSGWFIAGSAARTCKVGAQFYDATGAAIGNSIFGSGVADNTSTWTQLTASVTAPAGSARCRTSVQVSGNGAANEVHYLDDVVMYAVASGSPHIHWWREDD